MGCERIHTPFLQHFQFIHIRPPVVQGKGALADFGHVIQVDFGGDDPRLVRRPGNYRAPGIHDQRIPVGGEPGLLPHLVGSDYVTFILDGPGPDQHFPVVLPGVHGEIGRDSENLRPFQGHDPEHLSEPDIVADGQAQFPPFRIPQGKCLPRAHPVAFPAGYPVGQHHVKGMELGIFGGQGSVRAHQEGGVEGTGRVFRIAFINAPGFQPDSQFPGQFRHLPEGGTSRDGFCFSGHIPADVVHGFRQHHQTGSPGGRLPDIAFGRSQIGIFIILGVHLDSSSNEFGHSSLLSAGQQTCTATVSL